MLKWSPFLVQQLKIHVPRNTKYSEIEGADIHGIKWKTNEPSPEIHVSWTPVAAVLQGSVGDFQSYRLQPSSV